VADVPSGLSLNPLQGTKKKGRVGKAIYVGCRVKLFIILGGRGKKIQRNPATRDIDTEVKIYPLRANDHRIIKYIWKEIVKEKEKNN
jgi:hypothetical protein